MCRKISFGTGMTVLWMIVLSACLLSCGDVDLDIDQEQTEKPLRFIEFVLFPTAPYVDKSYIEKIPEEEVAIDRIDFETEKQAIQQVYSAFIEAYVAEDMTALQETLDITGSIEYGTTTGIVYGWNDVRIYIQANWEKEGADCQNDPNWKLTNFYLRPENVSTSWMAASAKGPMFYYNLVNNECYNAIGHFYLTKKSGEWRIHQIDGSKYFVDDRYGAP